MNGDRRAWILKFLQYLLGFAILTWVLRELEWREAVSLLAGITPGTIVALVAVSIGGLLCRFYTWHVLIQDVRDTSFAASARIDLVVNFINQLLPSRLTGRGAAPVVLRHYAAVSWDDAVAVTGAHTGLYAILYGIVAAAGIGFGYVRLQVGILALLMLSTALYLVAGAGVLLAGTNMDAMNAVIGRIDAVADRVPVIGGRLASLTEKAPEFTAAAARSFRDRLARTEVIVHYAIGWAGALMIAPGVRVWLLLTAFGVGFEPAVLLPVYLVAAYSVTLLPLTPGGIGITEATAVVVFTALGVPSSVAVPVILLDRFIGVYLPAISGWVPALRIDFRTLLRE